MLEREREVLTGGCTAVAEVQLFFTFCSFIPDAVVSLAAHTNTLVTS